MPTNAEIHAAIDLLIRQPNSHILTNAIADMLDDMVDNIEDGGAATPTIDQVLAAGGVIAVQRTIGIQQGGELRVRDMTGDGEDLLNIYEGQSGFRAFNNATDNETSISAYATATESEFRIGTIFEIAFGPSVVGFIDATTNELRFNATKYKYNGVQEFADNAAAATGGLEVGMVYRTVDLMKIVHA